MSSKDYPRRKWEEKEDLIIIARYPKEGAKGLESLLGRSGDSIRARASKLGVKMEDDARNMAKMRIKIEEYQRKKEQWARERRESRKYVAGRCKVSVRRIAEPSVLRKMRADDAQWLEECYRIFPKAVLMARTNLTEEELDRAIKEIKSKR